ncbi:MAG: aspartate kinase [Flavobacterium sp.]
MSIQTINIVLFGKGNVGTTLINQILESQTFFENSRNIKIQFAVIANSQKALFLRKELPSNWQELFDNASDQYEFQDILDFCNQQELDNLVAIDATASTDIVAQYELLVKSGFHIIAANKTANTLSQEFYDTLRRTLNFEKKKFLYATNVGAGLPIISTVRNLYSAGDKITKIRGVFSGTLSYIFNRFGAEDISFSQIVIEAENAGYTEPDSRQDLSGNDVVRKLLVLARELSVDVDFEEVVVDSLLPAGISFDSPKATYAISKELFDNPYQIAKLAQNPNHVLRYIGELDVKNRKLEVKLVSEAISSPLGQLKGTDNLVEIFTESYGENPIIIQGAGAGKEVTARGILSDLLQLSQSIIVEEAQYAYADREIFQRLSS